MLASLLSLMKLVLSRGCWPYLAARVEVSVSEQSVEGVKEVAIPTEHAYVSVGIVLWVFTGYASLMIL